MFTGIIEEKAIVIEATTNQKNVDFVFQSPIASQLKVDQSVSHNGVCLTVTAVDKAQSSYKVTAINETIKRSNLGLLSPGDEVNIERCLSLNSLLDGHLVQGHVDVTARCTAIEEHDGSVMFYFEYAEQCNPGYITVEKGSITVNGVSLTVVGSGSNQFSVALIPYTLEHTNLGKLVVGSIVNIEFDIVGKYVAKIINKRGSL